MRVVKVKQRHNCGKWTRQIGTHKRRHEYFPSLFWLLPSIPLLIPQSLLFRFPSFSLLPWEKPTEFVTKLYTVNFPVIISPLFSSLAHIC